MVTGYGHTYNQLFGKTHNYHRPTYQTRKVVTQRPAHYTSSFIVFPDRYIF